MPITSFNCVTGLLLAGIFVLRTGAGGHPADRDLEKLWTDLGTSDPVVAHQAIETLVAKPGLTVPFFRQRLHPDQPLDPRRLAHLLADLDSREFNVREKASQELEKLAEVAEPALKNALEGRPSLEARRRIERVLEKLKEERLHPSGDRLRLIRAVEVLEQIGNQQARDVLATLAKGTPLAQLTIEAKTALERLAKQPDSAP
jgi:hypothetical protein